MSTQLLEEEQPQDSDHAALLKDASALVGADIAPIQRPTVERSTIKLEEYSFLPRELHLVVDAAPGCGGVQWPAAEVLAKYLTWLSSIDTLSAQQWQDKQIVELGAGTGVLSLALASLLPKANIIATDMAQLLPLLQDNINLNQAGDKITAEVLSWGEPSHLKPDIILAADCVYLESTFPLLVDTLKELCTPDTIVLLSYKKRRRADKRFFNLLKKHFTWTDVDDPARDSYRRDQLFLFLLKKKPTAH